MTDAVRKALKLTKEQRQFLSELVKLTGAATPQELGPQTSQAENAARQAAKRRGWVTFDRHYWRITSAGRTALAEAEDG